MEIKSKNQINLDAYKTRMQTIFYNMDIKNNICADCGKNKSMDFASINNGIIICAECAKEHLSLGYNISFIHSLSEKWDDYLFNYIKVGGNSRFIQFCKDYKLIKEEDKNITKKYKSKGLTYYREILRSEVLGYDPPENINVNKAYEEEKNIPDNYPEFKKYTFVKHVDMNYLEKKFYTKKEEKSEEGIFGKIGGFFDNVKKNIGIGDWDIVKKVQDINISEVKQKGVDMFGYFFFGGNSQDKKEDNKKGDKNENIDNEIKNDKTNDNSIENNKNNNDGNDVKNDKETNKIFGVEDKNDNENIINNNIQEHNNLNIKEDNKLGNNIDIKKEDPKNEIIKENEGKIVIKEEIQILTEEKNDEQNININIIEKDNNEGNKIEENGEKEHKVKEKDSIQDKNENENDIEQILKENNLNNDNSKMNSEEKDELEKMLQE